MSAIINFWKVLMQFKVTTIVENTVQMGKGLLGEHGLSFLIETGNEKILFDTGQGMSLINNLKIMNHSAEDISKIVLSHGHYDHTGGVNVLMGMGAKFSLFAHPDVFCHKYSFYPNRGYMPIGFNATPELLTRKGIELCLDDDTATVAPGIITSGVIAQNTDFEQVEKSLCVKDGDAFAPDPLADDRCLLLDTREGTVVLLGCAHRGLINTLTRVREITGSPKIHAVIGGTHLVRASDTQIAQTIEALRFFNPDMICPSHCTGIRATVALANAFGNRSFPCNVGTSFSF